MKIEQHASGLWVPDRRIERVPLIQQGRVMLGPVPTIDSPIRKRQIGRDLWNISFECTFFPDRNPFGGKQIGWPLGWSLAAAVQTTTNSASRATASPASGSKTIDAGSTLCAVLMFGMDDNSNLGSTPPTSTYNSVAMTTAGALGTGSSGAYFAGLHTLVAPATGSNTVSITITGTLRDFYFNLIGLSGVDQTTPVRGGSYNAPSGAATDGSGNYTITITSQVGDISVACAKGGGAGITGHTQTSDGNNAAGFTGFESTHANGASSVGHQFTSSASNSICLVGASIAASGAAGTSLAWIKA